jgi:F-type H+-transporting ATPase subunit epsilon
MPDDKKVHLQIITPTGVKVNEKADMVIMRCTTGDMGIQPGHEPRSAILDVGVLRLLDSSRENRMAVFGGLAEINNDKVTIITSLAELPEDIDRSRAETDLERAVRREQEGIDDTADIYSNHVRMRRSMVRLEVSSYPIISAHSGEEE